MVTPTRTLIALFALGLLGPTSALAQPLQSGETPENVGPDIRIKIELSPSLAKNVQPPNTSHGYLRRKANPFMAPRGVSPMPRMVVALEAVSATTPAKPESAQVAFVYEIIDESFRLPLLAVRVGTPITILNTSLHEKKIYSPTHPTTLRAKKLASDEQVELAPIQPGELFLIRSHISPHIVGRIVAFETPYFQTPDQNAEVRFQNLPDGQWRVRIWYQNTWLPIEPLVITWNSKEPSPTAHRILLSSFDPKQSPSAKTPDAPTDERFPVE